MGFAVVEYSTPDEAVETQAALTGHQLANNKIRVTFCMPGKAATQIANMVLKSEVSFSVLCMVMTFP